LKIGEKGEVLVEYAEWLRNRVLKYGEAGYHTSFPFRRFMARSDISPATTFEKNIRLSDEIGGSFKTVS